MTRNSKRDVGHVLRSAVSLLLIAISGFVRAAEVETEALGRATYVAHCQGCHGERGEGDGPVARFLFPRPRDFVGQAIRLKSTPAQASPTDADMLAILLRGVPGTPMPSFSSLTSEERHAVIGYVRGFSKALAVSNQFTEAAKFEPPPWANSAASIRAGRAAYMRMGCASCHGTEGRGDGPLAGTLLDDRQAPTRPRDLVREPFKGGAGLQDIFVRITNGMEGTPMPAFSGIPDRERWQLAAFVQSIMSKTVSLGSNAGDPHVVVARRIQGKRPVVDPFSPVWKKATVVQVPLFPLSASRSPTRYLTVRTLLDGERVLMKVEWTDATCNDGPSKKVHTFADALAVQWASGAAGTFLGMGSQSAPVAIWHWRADWQREIADLQKGKSAPTTPDGDAGDTYPYPVRPAADADNPYVNQKRPSAVEELIAAGSTTLKPVSNPQVVGTGLWRKGTWHVVLSKTLDRGELSSSGQAAAKLAFAVWDGAVLERAAFKSVSSWYNLRIVDASR